MYHRFLFAPDDPGGQGGGDNPDGTDDEGTGGSPPEGTESGSGSTDDKDLVSRSELARANRDAAKYRAQAREAQDALKAREDQDKSDLEKERDRATKAEEKLVKIEKDARELRVQVLAGKVGIAREARGDAARLLDWDDISDPDDERQVEVALRDLVKDKPYLLGNVPGGADGGAGGSRDTGSQDMNSLLRQAAGRD